MKERDNIFLSQLLTERNNSDTKKLQILNFLIIINIALVGGILAENTFSYFIFCVKPVIILSYIQLTINLFFYIIYYREHHLSSMRDKKINYHFSTEKYIKYHLDYLYNDFFNLGIAWVAVKILLSLFLLFPLYIILNFNIYDYNSNNYYCLIILFIAFFLGFPYKIFSYSVTLINAMLKLLKPISKCISDFIKSLFCFNKLKNILFKNKFSASYTDKSINNTVKLNESDK